MRSLCNVSQNKGDFVVRPATSLDDLQWITNQIRSDDRTRPATEAHWYFTAGLTPSFYIGELNGNRISCLSLTWHGKGTGFYSGCFNVAKPFRGRRYGERTMKAVYTNVVRECGIYGYATLAILKHYWQAYGFLSRWSVKHYRLPIQDIRRKLPLPEPAGKILPASVASFEELAAYSADKIGSSQASRSILAAMLVHAPESSWVAIDNETGKIAGCLIMNRAVQFPKDGYSIAPFFADSVSTARILLRTAVEFAAQDPSKPSFLSLDTPEPNQEFVNILENELGVESTTEFVFVGTKNSPDKPHKKMFGLGSITVF